MIKSNLRAGRFMPGVILSLALLAGSSEGVRADAISDAINAASAKLVATQVAPPNFNTTGWEGQNFTGFNGTILAGLTSAYLTNGVTANKTAAEHGADYLIANVNNVYGGHYFANEVYGLSQVSSIQATPNSNPYHDAVLSYFTNTVPANVDTFVATLTTTISQSQINAGANPPYNGLDRTQLTIDLAHYTMAAYAVNAPNKVAFRNNLIIALGNVADVDNAYDQYQFYPTQALGAAVWALAKTGNGLDSTPITGPSGTLVDPVLQNAFGGLTLADLPAILASRINPTTHAFSQYLNYVDPSGYTDDTSFGILGLDAADFAGHTSTYAADIAAARLALSGAVDPSTGTTYDHISDPTDLGGEFAGNALQALASPVPEPASVAILAMGTMGLMLRKRRTQH